MKKVSAMLLTVLFTLSIAFSSFAQTYSLSAASITPPSRISSVKRSDGRLICKNVTSVYAEQIDYKARPVDKVRKTAEDIAFNVSKKYDITEPVSKIKYAGSKYAYYFAFESPKTRTYGIVVLVPVCSCSTVIITDTLTSRVALAASPFGRAEAKALAATAKRK